VPKNILFVFALIWTGLIAYFCLIRSSAIPAIEIPNLDKCIHTFFHFVFTIVWFLYFRKQLQFEYAIKPLMYAVLFSFVFGILIEILQQTITTTRQADVLDVVANIIGSILAVFIVLMANKFNFLNTIFKN
jgi:VanZ family protein